MTQDLYGFKKEYNRQKNYNPQIKNSKGDTLKIILLIIIISQILLAFLSGYLTYEKLLLKSEKVETIPILLSVIFYPLYLIFYFGKYFIKFN